MMKRKYIYISILTLFTITGLFYLKSIYKSNSIKINPVQVDEKYNSGKLLYEKNCISCHDDKMINRSMAPPLGGITKRRDMRWLYKFTRNSMMMFKMGDTIAVNLRKENFNLLMPGFPNLNNEKLDALYYYIEKEYEKNKPLKINK